jgi:hypothetical protein
MRHLKPPSCHPERSDRRAVILSAATLSLAKWSEVEGLSSPVVILSSPVVILSSPVVILSSPVVILSSPVVILSLSKDD